MTPSPAVQPMLLLTGVTDDAQKHPRTGRFLIITPLLLHFGPLLGLQGVVLLRVSHRVPKHVTGGGWRGHKYVPQCRNNPSNAGMFGAKPAFNTLLSNYRVISINNASFCSFRPYSSVALYLVFCA